MLTEELKKELAAAAMEARKNAYVPYSHFSVGAAVLTESGEIYSGCNIENASYPAGICAERTAIFYAVSRGHRRLRAVAVTGGQLGQEADDFCAPCGICLQVMSEFCSIDCPLIIVKDEEHMQCLTLGDFLPHIFDGLDDRKGE